jgi:hypothetical protein
MHTAHGNDVCAVARPCPLFSALCTTVRCAQAVSVRVCLAGCCHAAMPHVQVELTNMLMGMLEIQAMPIAKQVRTASAVHVLDEADGR